MKISILSNNLSNNCLGRAYLLAKVLKRSGYDVEIVGPVFGKGVWDPVDNNEFNYISIPGSNYPLFFKSIKEMTKKINGDIIYAVKPKTTSYGIGLLKKTFNNIPLVLDIDDWEVGFYLDSKSKFIKNLIPIWSPNGLYSTYLMEKLTCYADEITVSSSFLQKRFGGTIIPHGRDTDFFDPQKYKGKLIREKFGFKDEKIIMFLGTLRPHKGIDDLIQAVTSIDREDIRLVIVGAQDDNYTRKIKKMGMGKVETFGIQPFSKIPEFLSMADLVALPQKNSYSAIGQVPAKVFDAMAMAKPIISTNISDLPNILEGCGRINEPGDINGLAESIKYIIENENEARILGDNARKKCIEEYSWNVMEKKLSEIFEKLNSS